MLSAQGIRPGSINMGRILRQLRHRSGQSRLVTYHRPPIFGKDDYGVEGGTIVTNELLYPGLPALIRPYMTADYRLERAGANVIGAARVYTPNIQTIKGFSNFEQTIANPNFDEIEGWDRFIDRQRTIYTVPTSGTSGWASSDGSTFTSDGQELVVTIASTASAVFSFTGTANTLEADRIQFQIKATEAEGVANFESFSVWHGPTTGSDYRLLYDPVNIGFTADTWLTVDIPFVTGTVASGTSIYQDGTRYNVPVSGGSEFDYEANFAKFAINYNAKPDDTIKIRNIIYYKSISWHVHSLKELNEEFTTFNCVRTRGVRDSRRRAYN